MLLRLVDVQMSREGIARIFGICYTNMAGYE